MARTYSAPAPGLTSLPELWSRLEFYHPPLYPEQLLECAKESNSEAVKSGVRSGLTCQPKDTEQRATRPTYRRAIQRNQMHFQKTVLQWYGIYTT
ncbi:hypothetical protein H8959_022409 [Pygathrix nigripes]